MTILWYFYFKNFLRKCLEISTVFLVCDCTLEHYAWWDLGVEMDGQSLNPQPLYIKLSMGMYACNPEAEELETESSGSCWLANLTKSSSSTFMDRPYLKKKQWDVSDKDTNINHIHIPHIYLYIFTNTYISICHPLKIYKITILRQVTGCFACLTFLDHCGQDYSNNITRNIFSGSAGILMIYFWETWNPLVSQDTKLTCLL